MDAKSITNSAPYSPELPHTKAFPPDTAGVEVEADENETLPAADSLSPSRVSL